MCIRSLSAKKYFKLTKHIQKLIIIELKSIKKETQKLIKKSTQKATALISHLRKGIKMKKVNKKRIIKIINYLYIFVGICYIYK